MPEPGLQLVLRRMRSLMARSAMGLLTDDALLERFLNSTDEAAFEVLLWRHGPMVLSLCRRILRQAQDAEEAFQSTFLILSRKARSIGKRQSVGSWLYKVAYRVACRKRAAAARLPRLSPLPVALASRVSRLADPGGAASHVDQEINRLPSKYREPIILYYVQGLDMKQAAHRLGVPPTTFATRLARARQRLKQRLAHRGFGLPCTGIGGLFLADTSLPQLSTALMRDTARAAATYAVAGKAASTTISPAITSLMRGVSMGSRKASWLMVGCLVVGLGLSAVLMFRGALEGAPPETANTLAAGFAGKEKPSDETVNGKLNAGDGLRVNFTLPFKDALAKAKNEKKLLFLKPIFGGMDKAAATDYRCGLW